MLFLVQEWYVRLDDWMQLVKQESSLDNDIEDTYGERLEVVFGLLDVDTSLPCLGFVVDTTGSMSSIIYRGRQGRFFRAHRPTRVPPLSSFTRPTGRFFHAHRPTHVRTFALFPLAFALFPFAFASPHFPLAFVLGWEGPPRPHE